MKQLRWENGMNILRGYWKEWNGGRVRKEEARRIKR